MKHILTSLVVIVAICACGVIAVSAANGNSQQGGLPALEKRVAILETKITAIVLDLASIHKSIDALTAGLANVTKTVIALTDDVKCLKTAVANLKGQNNWAVVDSSGTVERHSVTKGDILATKLGTGTYDVVFTKLNVTGCAYVATIGDPGKMSAIPGMVTVSGGPINGITNDVQVQTFDKTGTLTDNSFHLYVSCP